MKIPLAFKLLILTLLAITIGLTVWVMSILNVPSWSMLHRVAVDLKEARSVTLKEYAWDTALAQRSATSEDIERLRRIATKWPQPFYSKGSLCFEPHHDIEIIRADGSEIKISVCFLCGNMLYRDGDKALPHPLPPYIERPLTVFFESVGMTPKSQEEYDAYGPRFLRNDTGGKKSVKE